MNQDSKNEETFKRTDLLSVFLKTQMSVHNMRARNEERWEVGVERWAAKPLLNCQY